MAAYLFTCNHFHTLLHYYVTSFQTSILQLFPLSGVNMPNPLHGPLEKTSYHFSRPPITGGRSGLVKPRFNPSAQVIIFQIKMCQTFQTIAYRNYVVYFTHFYHIYFLCLHLLLLFFFTFLVQVSNRSSEALLDLVTVRSPNYNES